MALGTSIFLIAVGAILRYAVRDVVDFIDIPTVGTILLVVGILGLVLSLILIFTKREPVPDQIARDRERDRY